MKREYYRQHSEALGEDMSMIVYGEGGYPVIAFQAQDAKSNNFEDFGMIDVLAPFIDEGRIQVFSVDNLDEQSWSDEGGDPAARSARQEDYFRFVTDELVPRVHAWNNSDRRPLAVGCSMGATHAAIAALRRPDLFQGCIALSGVYSTSFFFGDWMDENLYNNDIPAFLTNMPADHPYVSLYNQRQLVLCVGQGAWEMGVDDLRYIDGQLGRLGVNHWCDFWGYDVNHDWPWWRKQMPYFMDEVLREIEASEAAAAQAAATGPKPAAKKAPAKRTTTRKAPAKKAAAAKPAAEASEPAAKAKAEKAAPSAAAEKPAAKRTTARKAPAKAASTQEPATKAAATEDTSAQADPTAKKAPAKRTTTRKASTTSKAAATPKTAAAEATSAPTEPAAKKPAARKTTTTKSTSAKKTTTRRSTKKADTAE